jgi:hypothetical protein
MNELGATQNRSTLNRARWKWMESNFQLLTHSRTSASERNQIQLYVLNIINIPCRCFTYKFFIIANHCINYCVVVVNNKKQLCGFIISATEIILSKILCSIFLNFLLSHIKSFNERQEFLIYLSDYYLHEKDEFYRILF